MIINHPELDSMYNSFCRCAATCFDSMHMSKARKLDVVRSINKWPLFYITEEQYDLSLKDFTKFNVEEDQIVFPFDYGMIVDQEGVVIYQDLKEVNNPFFGPCMPVSVMCYSRVMHEGKVKEAMTGGVYFMLLSTNPPEGVDVETREHPSQKYKYNNIFYTHSNLDYHFQWSDGNVIVAMGREQLENSHILDEIRADFANNANVGIAEIQWMCKQGNYIIEESPRKACLGSKKIHRAHMRPKSIIMNKKQASSIYKGGTHAGPIPHPRRGHWRYFTHERYKKDKVFVKPTMVGEGDSEWEFDNRKYKIL